MTKIESTLEWINVGKKKVEEVVEEATVYKKLPKELWAEGFTTFTEADRYADQYRDEYRFSIVNVPGGAWSITEPQHGDALPALPTPRHGIATFGEAMAHAKKFKGQYRTAVGQDDDGFYVR